MADVLVTAGIVTAASMLVIPWFSAGRYQAQVTACRERLHRLGTVLVDYSRIHDVRFRKFNKRDRSRGRESIRYACGKPGSSTTTPT